ncbi:hypothetical protein [Aeromonas hydrophila]|uniref:hypothetical protein n=1 Tax=Aeromonas hydrophila TaxID=644 RepID=UPI001000613D|nr:hypothetical protein [Aeromonas hydrophila]RUQ13070.1 hypothetical protein CX648_17455 [Aeromonas dhakensis]
MTIYRRGMIERQDNGVYLVNGVMWYSVWSFKKKFGIMPNTNEANLLDAINLSRVFNDEHILIEPEVGEFRTVKGFMEAHLRQYYQR